MSAALSSFPSIFLQRRVQRILLWRRCAQTSTHSALQASRLRLDAATRRLSVLSTDVHRLTTALATVNGPFTAEMTIDQAWQRHAAAGQVFARHHLPDCQSCAVRFDETLAEAAEAYRLPLDQLLAQLNALL